MWGETPDVVESFSVVPECSSRFQGNLQLNRVTKKLVLASVFMPALLFFLYPNIELGGRRYFVKEKPSFLNI